MRKTLMLEEESKKGLENGWLSGGLIKIPYTKAFEKLLKATRKEYLWKKVPAKYRSRYGRRYDPKEVKSVAYAIARARGIKTDR